MAEIKSNKIFYYSITNDSSSFVSVNMELDEPIEHARMACAVKEASKWFPYLQVRLKAQEEDLVLEPNDAPVELYQEDGCWPFRFSENGEHLYRFSAEGKQFRLSFNHGLMDAAEAFRYMKAVLQLYYQKEEKIELQEEAFRAGDAEAMADPYEQVPAGTVPQRTKEEPQLYKLPETRMEGYQTFRFAVSEEQFVQFTKKNQGSVNSMLAWLLEKAIRNVHPEALQEPLAIATAINAKPILGVEKAWMTCLHTAMNAFDAQLDACDIAQANAIIYKNIVDQCEKQVLFSRLAGITWLDRYLEQLPDLETKKQVCQKSIGMQRATANISYTGKFEWGAVEKHIRSCYTYADAASMLIEVNCVNGKFCFAFTQKFASDCYVKAFRALLEQYGISCTELEMKKLYV